MLGYVIWLIAGTDSGFEGPTKVCYERIWISILENKLEIIL